MRIAFISELIGAAWGGSELLWNQAASALCSQGHKVLASVNRHPFLPEPIRNLRQMGVQIDEREWVQSSLPNRVWQRFKYQPITHPGWKPSWDAICNFRPDLVCISNGGVMCGERWMTLCNEHQIPYVNIAQSNSECEGSWPDNEHLDAVRSAIGGAKRAFFVSHANLRLFEKQIACRLTNAEVVANPFGVAWDVDLPWPDQGTDLRLACVGRLEPHAKGQDLLFEVFSMDQWRGRNISIALYGCGRHSRVVHDLIRFYGLQDRVSVPGQVGDVKCVWAKHHGLVLPSRYEGLPLAIVEAMLCGRPVITNNVSGNAEFLEDGVTGFISRTTSPEDLNDAMERAWQARDSWQTMGQAAGKSIRCKVPKDPGGAFADKLLSLV